MKVLLFMTQFYQLGGAELLAVELAEELNRRGISCDVASMYTEKGPGVARATQELLRSGVRKVHFLGLRVHPSMASMLVAIMKLRRLIKHYEYDIVETSMLSPTLMAVWAIRGRRPRHVAGLHQVFDRSRENGLIHRFWRLSLRLNGRIRYYAISDYVATHWVNYSGTEPKHLRTIYNAISDRYFEVRPDRNGVREELQIPAKGRLAIYVGRLAVYKGISTLLYALGPVFEQYDLYLLYIGSPDFNVAGTRETLQQMKEQVAKNRWGDRVKFLGYRRDIPRLMASADVLVHPAFMEGFGLTLVEAMAARLPVVATNVDAIPEILAQTSSLMVPAREPDALREAVLATLTCSPADRARTIERGRVRAEKFRMIHRTDAMIDLFSDLLRGGF